MLWHNMNYKLIYCDLIVLQNNGFHVKDLGITIVATTEIFQWVQSKC